MDGRRACLPRTATSSFSSETYKTNNRRVLDEEENEGRCTTSWILFLDTAVRHLRTFSVHVRNLSLCFCAVQGVRSMLFPPKILILSIFFKASEESSCPGGTSVLRFLFFALCSTVEVESVSTACSVVGEKRPSLASTPICPQAITPRPFSPS